ncbi:MAG: OmpA family protein, partial [Deltaproteobacteria bacterium]|nr:OmpA family protein [Deltaproteobacteria bacterium]
MRKKIVLISGLFFILMSMGCANTYSSKEFNAVVNELDSCTKQLKMAQDENAALRKLMDDTKKELDNSSSDLLAYRDEKQQLLDKNIQCLEEKKVLLQQISRFNDIIQERKEAQWRINKAYEYILSYLERERLNDQVYIIRSQDKIKIVLPQRVLFPNPKSAWLTPRGTWLIEKIGRGLKQMDTIYVEIGGHTDNTELSDSVRKVYPSNWHLAQGRSMAVLMVLSEAGISQDKMCAISYGDTKPIADTKTEDGRAMNRRV